MAAGASSPELFAAFTSIFITHSALGIGTVVGSEIFNTLVICAGAIFASKNNELVLDPIVVVRDVAFYAISLILLYNAFSDRRVIDDGTEHVFITLFDTCLFFGCYILYVLTCAYFERILCFLNIDPSRRDGEEEQCHYELSQSGHDQGKLQKQMSLNSIAQMPFVRSCGGREPRENFHTHMHANDGVTNDDESVVAELYVASEFGSKDDYFRHDDLGGKKSSLFLVDRLRPELVHGIDDIERGEDGSISLFLWQRSAFYDMAKIDMNAWQLRWFTFTDGRVVSTPYRRNHATILDDAGVSTLPKISSFDADESRLMVRIRTTRDYIFLSPSHSNFVAAVGGFEECLHIQDSAIDDYNMGEPEVHSSLIALPRGGFFTTGFAIYCITFPIKACVQFIIPDVRNGNSISPTFKAGLACIASILSLSVGSYAMAASLEELSHELNIPETIVGATISAAGTSLPNLISSQCAARLGLGNMAISNVMGSNTFNILVGLGIPWMIYTIVFGVAYSELPSNGIDESMIVMTASLLMFILMVLKSGFKLFLWHAYLFCVMYVLFVIHVVWKYFL
jgi:Ca2+/Na+ antiporter